MYRSLAYVSLILFAVVISSGSARAQTVQVNLGQALGSANIITFTNVTPGTHHLDLQLGPCMVNTCTITSGTNSHLNVNGSDTGPASSYTFTTTLSGGVFPSLTPDAGGNGLFDYNPNGSGTTFSISNIGSPLGNLGLNIFINTVADNSMTPTFSGTYIVTSASGQPGQFFLNGNSGDFNFTVLTVDTLTHIFGGANGANTAGNIDHGAVHLPEPTSIALFGSGLLLLGRVLRRRKTLAPAEPSEG